MDSRGRPLSRDFPGDSPDNSRLASAAAPAGSALLAHLATIQSVKAWLEPLKFVGIALLLTGISLALATIRKVLQFQAGRIIELVSGSGM